MDNPSHDHHHNRYWTQGNHLLAISETCMRWLIAHLLFYPSLAWNVLLGRVLRIRHWWDPIDDHVILGARPFARDVARLDQLGVTAVVNTCEEYEGPVQQYEQCGIEQLWIPTIDFTPPSLENICQGVRFIQEKSAEGGKIYVHCKAGRGRSATVALCWLMVAHEMTVDQAQQRLLECRPHILRGLPRREAVQQFRQLLEDGRWQEPQGMDGVE